jgi:hypothetical protein
VSTSTLRYGMCCCSDDHFDYTKSNNLFYSQATSSNLCVSSCIFYCLGGESSIENQHSDDTVTADMVLSPTNCRIIS